MSRKSEKLYGAIGGIGDKYLADAGAFVPQKKSIKRYVYSAVAAMLVCGVIVTAALVGRNPSAGPAPVTPGETEQTSAMKHSSPFVAAAAEYPETTKYPPVGSMTPDGFNETKEAWREATEKKLEELEVLSGGAVNFFKSAVSELMTETSGNVVFSPTNVYLALSMLSECASGETREQILSLLGEENVSDVRASASAVWNAAYTDDGITRSLLANSLWLGDDFSYNEELVKTLADKYFASSFVGEMGSPEYDGMLRKWLDEQTERNLEEYSEDEKFENDTALSLVSAIHFRSDWESGFVASETKKDTFRGLTDTECDFMIGDGNAAYYGNGFTAVDKYFANNEYRMTFILPDEGKTPEELFLDEGALDFAAGGKTGEDSVTPIEKEGIVIHVPKFDVGSKLDLIPTLEKLGMTDAFAEKGADFSSVSDNAGIFVSKVSHAARFYIDEDGCEGAAFTKIDLSKSAPPESVLEVTFDRPFIFVVRGAGDLPLFVGIVNEME